MPGPNSSLEALTFWLVVATFLLALGTLGTAIAAEIGVRLERRQLLLVQVQQDLDRQQLLVTREQLRAHLEVANASWSQPGELPALDVQYVSGREAATEVWVWFRTHDDRRFGKAANAPSLSRPSHRITIDELTPDLERTWTTYFGAFDASLNIVPDDWWAAVTWLTAEGTRHCWAYIQRTHNVEQQEFLIPSASAAPDRSSRWRRSGTPLAGWWQRHNRA